VQGGLLMNNKDLHTKVHAAMYKLIREKGVASPVEVLIEIGVLTKEDYENWRFGRIHYLESVCRINLSKLSTIMHEIRVYAGKHHLKPSWSAYQKWGKGHSIRLRFSKSGKDQIERSYATHYVSQTKAEEAQKRHVFQKRKKDLVKTIAPCGLICGLCSEATHCTGCRAESGCNRAAVCYQRKCTTEKGLKGCWQCKDFPCGLDMFSKEHDVRLVTFVRCAREDGVKSLAGYLLHNQDKDIIYHSDPLGHTGDYDGLETEEAVLELLRKGK